CAFRNGHAHVAHALAALGAFSAQLLQAPYPPFVARAARFNTLADPDLFLCQELVEAGLLLLFRLEHLGLACLPLREVAGKAVESTAVELDYARRHFVDKAPIESDDHDAAARFRQHLL